MNLFKLLRLESDFQNLLGDQKVEAHNHLSLEEYEEIKKSVLVESNNQINFVFRGLSALRDGCLCGKELASFTLKAYELAKLYETNGTGIYPVGMYSVAYLLSWPFALIDQVLPPNDLGYFPDSAMSLARKDEIILDYYNRARSQLTRDYSIFGDNYEELVDLYNKLLPKIEEIRPVFMGDKVSKDCLVFISLEHFD